MFPRGRALGSLTETQAASLMRCIVAAMQLTTRPSALRIIGRKRRSPLLADSGPSQMAARSQLLPSWVPVKMPRSRHPGGSTLTSNESLARQLRELEELLLVPDVRKSKRLIELLADDFVEFGSSGRVYSKTDVVAVLQAESPVAQTTSDFKVMSLAPGVALLTYRIRRHSEPPVDSLRCSVWRNSNGQWQMLFHQGTVIPAG